MNHLSSSKLSLSKSQFVCRAVVQQVAWGKSHYVSVSVASFSFPHTDACVEQTGNNKCDDLFSSNVQDMSYYRPLPLKQTKSGDY